MNTLHPDGSRTVVFRSGTPFTTMRRIAKRFKGSTLYSDNRLEIPALFDPRVLKYGSGLRNGKPHGYLGRHVLDLGDRHAHAIVDIPWNALKVAMSGARRLRAKFDPWHRYAHKTRRAELLAIRNPRPTGSGDRVIIEAALHVNRKLYEKLRRSREFEVLPDGVLARRGRHKKATNIFLVPP